MKAAIYAGIFFTMVAGLLAFRKTVIESERHDQYIAGKDNKIIYLEEKDRIDEMGSSDVDLYLSVWMRDDGSD